MYATRAENLSRLLKTLAPTLLGFLGVLLLASPVRLAEGVLPTPLLPLVVVFFWSIYSPQHLPAFGVFLIGIFQDLVSGGPLGMWPTIYLVISHLVATQRAYFQGREQRVVWLGFAVATLIASLILWSVMSLLTGANMPVWRLAAQMAATVAIYPIVASGFEEFHRRVITEI